MKKLAIITAYFVMTSPLLAGEWEWNLSENSMSVGVADADWTIDKVFPGTKFLFDGHYVIKRKNPEPEVGYIYPEDLFGIVDVDLQWGKGETGLEVGKLTLTPYAIQWDIRRETERRLRAVLDQVEFGVVQFSFDDPLGIDSYTELTFIRAGRTWNYRRQKDSAFSIYFGLKASAGWAWADSIDPTYDDVSNPITGFGATLGFDHETWGTIYTDDRVVTGYTLGSPTGSTTSREARIRFGYFNRIYRCVALDVFLEKRSFNFADSDEPDLYTKSKRTGVEISCKF